MRSTMRCAIRLRGLLAAAAACFALVPAPRLAAQRADTIPYTLGEVVVSARKPVSESAATVRVVTADDIRAAGARTLDEAIALVPGFHVRTGNDGVPRIDARGFRPRHLVLLLDGVPLNSTYDGQFDPTLIPVEEIAYIKVTTGPSSVLYGEGALAGTIDVVTRTGAGRPQGTLTVEGRDRAGAMLRATGGAGSSRLSGFASASALRTDGYPAPLLAGTSDALRANSARKRIALFGSATAAPSDHVSLGLILAGVHGAYGIPPTEITDPSDPFASRPTYERVTSLDQGSAQLAARFAPSGPVSVRTWAYINQYDQDRSRYDDSTFSSMSDSTVKGSFSESSRSRVSGIGAQVAADAGRAGRITLGVTAERDAWHSALHVRDVPAGTSGGGASGGGGGGGKGGGGGGGAAFYTFEDVIETRRLDRAGVALEYELRPLAALGLELGVGYDWLAKDSAGHDDAGSLTTGVAYDLAPRTHVHASVARKIRFPAIRQLYDPAAGNPALHSERANEYEAGVAQDLPRGSSVSLTGFRSDVKGFIERPDPTLPFANADAFRFTGLELAAETRPVESLMLRAGYTFLDALDLSPGSNRETLQYEPRHTLTLESRYTFAFHLHAAVSMSRVAGQVYNSRTTPVQQGSLPNYTLADVRLAQPLRGDAVQAYVGATNLFDASYQDEYGFMRPGRVLYAGLTVGW